MSKFVSSQEVEVCKSIIGLSQYSLKEEYQHLSTAPNQWITWTKEEFQQASVEYGQGFSSVDDRQDFSSVEDRRDFGEWQEISFDPLDTVSDDHNYYAGVWFDT